MKVYYKPTPQLTVEIEAADIKELFKELGPVQEVLGPTTCICGKCQCIDIRLLHRKQGKFDFYELMCTKKGCGAKLALGQNDAGNLFPRRYQQDPNDNKKPLKVDGKTQWLKDNGWLRWQDQSNEGQI